ncbi:MAG: glycosyltransferase family 4 protein, partial [Anaerolineae bacterium]|nr:glycosyltransferase family 4 protein [Anaerolineae bacterium]
GVFCHMIPRYVMFAAPWTTTYHKPLVLWYTHRQISRELHIARALATHILTASPNSFPLPSEKVHVVGHGIETTLFPLSEEEAYPPAIIHVARLSRIKGQDRLLRAVSRIMGRSDAGPLRVHIVGGPVENEPEYPGELNTLTQHLDPVPPVTFTGPLARTVLAEVVENSAIAVNLSPPGLFDKAALETMLAGKPTLVMNTDFLPVLGDTADLLYLPHDTDDDQLAERLAYLLALGPEERATLGYRLRERVINEHSLGTLMDRIAHLMYRAAHDA